MEKKKKIVCMALAGLCALVLLGGCAGSYQARSVDLDAKNSPLVNPSILKEGEGDQALYRYVKPGFDAKKYTKAIIDPVMISKDGELSTSEMESFQTLANNAYVYLTDELKKYVTIVNTPGPGTMRVQWAIIDADSAKPVRNTLSTFIPIGMGLSVIKLAAVGKQSGVGEITTEIKYTDAVTGELLGAALDRRVGGKDVTELWSSWYNADEALKYWAKRIGYVLCTEKKLQGCVEP